ncbi:MAG: hypothetical protein ABI390_11465, partial [Daejeonella sp.]
MSHTFHIPVLGLSYSIDTPIKVAKFGISSVASIVDDTLVERMRQYYCQQLNEEFIPIGDGEYDCRAKRITAYLNLMQDIVDDEFAALRNQPFEPLSDITRYFQLLPESSAQKIKYQQMQKISDPADQYRAQEQLRTDLQVGSIDVNIMSKVDKMNFAADKTPLGDSFSDALAALRGFAKSRLKSSVVISAGLNPRLYSYLENFSCFFPDHSGLTEKRIILKVSDFRSANIQAKFLAKKGLWVSEFRIESGLNCGGHAFATEGFLLGPVLEEFKQKRQQLQEELFLSYQAGLESKGFKVGQIPSMRITVQGGIGTASENKFLIDHYGMDGTGWGSSFLLVPEVTNVDNESLVELANASKDDFYLSNSSPLGVPFNNFRKSSAEKLRLDRIAKGRPGSPCTKKYLVSNTEFTKEPICTASREYQKLKLEQLAAQDLPQEQYNTQFDQITEKSCLCKGLTTSVYRKNNMLKAREEQAVAICPGPNLAYFSGIYTLDEMVKHIYNKLDLLPQSERSHMFINELDLYIDYLENYLDNHNNSM